MKTCNTMVGTLALLALAVPASAAIVIDFGQGTLSPSGTITVSGSQATGVNIAVDTMTVVGSSGFDGLYDLFGSGPNSLFGDSNGSALVNFNTATGGFTVVGGVCAIGNNSCNGGAGTLVASTTLATGTAASASISTLNATTLVFQEADTKGATLLAALGIAGSTPFRLMSANFNYTGSGPFTVTSTDIQNSSVPEPASILLLGTAMLGVTGLIRRRTRKA